MMRYPSKHNTMPPYSSTSCCEVFSAPEESPKNTNCQPKHLNGYLEKLKLDFNRHRLLFVTKLQCTSHLYLSDTGSTWRSSWGSLCSVPRRTCYPDDVKHLSLCRSVSEECHFRSSTSQGNYQCLKETKDTIFDYIFAWASC